MTEPLPRLQNGTVPGVQTTTFPIRIVQFGEGNFLRAFVEPMVEQLNKTTDFDGSVAIIKPRMQGTLSAFREQDNLYTVVLRGREQGHVLNTHQIITSVKEVLDGKNTWEDLETLAICPTVRYIISNTTEAGITLVPDDSMNGIPTSFPGKLTKFLYTRYQAFSGSPDSGVIVLPCELIENNGDKLLECVEQMAKIWQLPDGFTTWVEKYCHFLNTLVDRIVTGFPAAEAEKLWQQFGYRDTLLVTGEPYALWVIEAPDEIAETLPFGNVGLPVICTDDLRPYREQKVRVLNGAHTSTVLMGWLCGKTIVRELLEDPITNAFLRQTVEKEIVPYVPLDREVVTSFAEAVFERFANPFIDHRLLDISLNSVSKWKTRVLPTLRDYAKNTGTLPKNLTFSFAALLAFYTGTDLQPDGLYTTQADGTAYIVRDNNDVLAFFAENSTKPVMSYVGSACARTDFWGEDLRQYPGFVDAVAKALTAIRKDPIAALQEIII